MIISPIPQRHSKMAARIATTNDDYTLATDFSICHHSNS